MNQKTIGEKVLIGLLIILNALFLYYWIALASNYCLHSDDAHFMWKMREYSIFEYVKEMYMTRGGNFISYTLNGVVFTISNWFGAYRFWFILFYIFGIVMTWGAFRKLPWFINSGYKGWLGLIALYNVYVLTSIDYAVFNWLCAMEYFLFAPTLCLLLKYMHKEELNWRQWLLFLLLAIFIAGNSVSISTITFMVLFAYGMYMLNKEKWNIRNTWAKPQVRRLIGITVIMLAIFAIVFVAPGNWSRMDEEFDMEQPHSIIDFIRAIAECVGMFTYMMAFYLPYHVIAVVLGAWAGRKYPCELPYDRKKAILGVVVVFIIYLIASVVPLAYLSNGFEIQRNYIQICFFYALTLFVVGYLWTNNTTREYKAIMPILYTSILFLIVIACLNIRQDIPVARAYNNAHQERLEYLIELRDAGQKETVIVAPYPSTHTPDAKYNVCKVIGKATPTQAIYYEADTDTVPTDYTFYIRELYHLGFDFVLAEPKKYSD